MLCYQGSMEADEVEDSRGIRSIEVQDKMENVWRNLHTKKGIRYAEKRLNRKHSLS